VGTKEISHVMKTTLQHLYSIGGNKLVGVACLAIIRVLLMNHQGRLQGQLFETAFLKRVPQFFRILLRNIFICIAASTVESTRQYLLDSLAIQWRGWVTELLHAKYFSRMVRNLAPQCTLAPSAQYALKLLVARCHRIIQMVFTHSYSLPKACTEPLWTTSCN
jgi:hypothetical protein